MRFEDRIKEIQEIRYSGEFESALRNIRDLHSQFNEKTLHISCDIPIPVSLQRKVLCVDDEEGQIHQAMEEFEKARRCFEIAFRGRKKVVSDCPDNVGVQIDYAYSAFKKGMLECVANTLPRQEIVSLFETAELIIRKVIARFNDVSVSDLGNMHHYLGFISQFKGDYGKALYWYRIALRYRKRAKDIRGKALTCFRMGECHAKLSKAGSAGYCFSKSLEIFKDIQDPVRIKQAEDAIKGLTYK